MHLPTPETPDAERAGYVGDLQTLAKAQNYITKVFGEEEAIDYMITECKNYAKDGKFSKHCYEYAEKELPQLTEAEIAAILPKDEDGNPIWGHKKV